MKRYDFACCDADCPCAQMEEYQQGEWCRWEQAEKRERIWTDTIVSQQGRIERLEAQLVELGTENARLRQGLLDASAEAG